MELKLIGEYIALSSPKGFYTAVELLFSSISKRCKVYQAESVNPVTIKLKRIWNIHSITGERISRGCIAYYKEHFARRED